MKGAETIPPLLNWENTDVMTLKLMPRRIFGFPLRLSRIAATRFPGGVGISPIHPHRYIGPHENPEISAPTKER